jgi:predicted nucleotidyltransferase
MLAQLFASPTLVDLLSILFLHPEKEYHVNELARLTGRFPRSVHLALRRLEELGLVKVRWEGNLKQVCANQDNPIYPELKSIIYKTVGLGDALRKALENLGAIESAFIYGSVAKGTESLASDVDLMIIGQVNLDELTERLNEVEQELNREVNYVVFSPEEWLVRLESGDSFVLDVESGEKIELLGG